jgi:hypothetical protein
MVEVEQRIIKYLHSLEVDELFRGSGNSLFGELFREYICLTIHRNWPLNLRLSYKIEEYLETSENSSKVQDLSESKRYLQLLCFYLSYRNYFGFYQWKGAKAKEITLIPVKDYLKSRGCHTGFPGSGNFAMFFAILIFNDSHNANDPRLEEWFDFMDEHMNDSGFWGDMHITYQMQNGYHQYEIYSYFNRKPRVEIDIESILRSQDSMGHFGPRIGGGGCYDFDAVSLLLRLGYSRNLEKPLSKLLDTLISEQNKDGGFCESSYIKSYRDSCWTVFKYTFRDYNIPRLKSAVRFFIQFKSYVTLRTHWSTVHRKFHESNLWDTWFRLMVDDSCPAVY